jgi:hypothetical protein
MAKLLEGSSPGLLAIVGLAGTILGAGISNEFSYEINNRKTDVALIKQSVDLLKAAYTPETKPLREWAIKVMEDRGTA